MGEPSNQSVNPPGSLAGLLEAVGSEGPLDFWYSAKRWSVMSIAFCSSLRGALGDVGEDPALRGLVDVRGVVGVEDRDHRARGFTNDLGDQIERMLGAQPEPDQRDVGALPGCRCGTSETSISRAITS